MILNSYLTFQMKKRIQKCCTKYTMLNINIFTNYVRLIKKDIFIFVKLLRNKRWMKEYINPDVI